ncbi:glycosyltransferase [Streptomyces orinoci]|uniref:Glycosyltransferase n=1 Tax=Streptomyces orinoci TaxID=67339 RepID=A0ABV3K5S4_STRON|nr:glycosyltransferase [Streptomyces orinoci]
MPTAPVSTFPLTSSAITASAVTASAVTASPVTASAGAAAPGRLTVGMAVHDDYDGAYFTALALRLYHPEVADRVEILLLDNDPHGPAAEALRALEGTVPGLRYLPVDQPRGTAVRDIIFREARTEWVMCVDCHVLLVPGALARFLAYADAHPHSCDLLQGPVLSDDLCTVQTHMDPVFNNLYGVWGCDPRGMDPDAPPFEIGMQGLGLFACRKDAWLGFNPRMRGHGGEEGYIHKKYRAAGARVLCLPFLRWTHRFARPHGTGYPVDAAERCRNYLLAWEEVGMAVEPVLDYYRETCGEVVERWLADYLAEKNHPLNYFDALVCVNPGGDASGWAAASRRFRRLGVADRVRRLVPPESGDPRVVRALAHRMAIAQARQQGLEHVLVFEDQVAFREDAPAVLAANLSELAEQRWTICHLGEAHQYHPAPGCHHLQTARDLTSTDAIAYHARIYDRLLAELPSSEPEIRSWLEIHTSLERFYAHRLPEGVFKVSPTVAVQGGPARDLLRTA